MEGIEVGRLGMVLGIVVGMFGKDGMFGNDGIWLLGLGREDKGLVGNGGSAAWGRVVGIAGNGEMAVGNVGTAGAVCNRWRAARVIWMLDMDIAMIREKRNINLAAAIFWRKEEG